jgi:hypothetical protein
MTLPLWKNLTHPLIASALHRRSLDNVIDILISSGQGGAQLSVPLLLALVAGVSWFPVQVILIWLEGGTLYSYTSSKHILWKDFAASCNRWFGIMLLFRFLGVFLLTSLVTGTVLLALMVRKLGAPIIWLVVVGGLLSCTLVNLLFEIIRTTVVVYRQRMLGNILHNSFQLIQQKALTLLIFNIISIISMVTLLLVQQWFKTAIPISWWLLSFVTLQILNAMRDWLWLARRSGQVTIALSYKPSLTGIS